MVEVALEQFFYELFGFPLIVINSALFHAHLPPLYEVYDAARYHTIGLKLGGFIFDSALGWSRSKSGSVLEGRNLGNTFYLQSSLTEKPFIFNFLSWFVPRTVRWLHRLILKIVFALPLISAAEG
jgi:hypothetical protein